MDNIDMDFIDNMYMDINFYLREYVPMKNALEEITLKTYVLKRKW